jgi:maleate isomerase
MQMTRPKRLGMLAPSSNTVLEPETMRLLPRDGSVTAHVSRLRVTRIANDAASLGQFDFDRVLASAELLADAEVDVILWNGTAAGWLGFDHDQRMVAAIETRTGIRTTTAVLAINEALAQLEARRIGLVTPYVAAIEARIIDNYRGIGIETASSIRLDLTENTAYADVTPAEIAGMVRKAAKVPLDAVLILCTNLAGASVAPALAAELGVPVLDSVKVAIEHCLSLLGSGSAIKDANPRC